MKDLILYTKEYLLSLTKLRSAEIKLGERVQTILNIESLALTSCKFVLIGLPEDVGVKANLGKTGSRTAWFAALNAILNIQSTSKFRGDELAILGHIDFEKELKEAGKLNPEKETDLKKLRDLVNKIDEKVAPVIGMIFASGKIPIIIGGGHNNCYPILKAYSGLFNKPVNVINLDAHADFRPLEGRHSGNGFNYAFQNGYMDKYAVIGLHENYNSQLVVNKLKSKPEHFQVTFYEDFISESTSHSRAFQEALNFTNGLCGLEIDLDCTQCILSSAVSSCGFSLLQIRDMIAQTKVQQLFYLHISEGAAKIDDGRETDQTGKIIAYLISDFIKAQM
ncbi:MAG: arginase family protein [Flavobacterium sp.]|nr:arginase family protein [Pedobacter sp.]